MEEGIQRCVVRRCGLGYVGTLVWCLAPPPCSQFDPTVDAMDNIDTEVDLLYYCHSHNMKAGHRWSSGRPRTLTVRVIGFSSTVPE